MLKKAQVIMLPTENKINGSIVKDIKEESKILHIKQKDYCEHEDFVAQHLYIISDDEIKEGDLHITSDHSGFGFRKYKIIATTDTSLNYETPFYGMDEDNNFPQPSQQFIEKYIESYNKGEVITDVLVEYEDYDWDLLTSGNTTIHQRVKVNPKDNTITIKKLKDSWNREEIIKLLNKLNNTLNIGSDLTLEQWIEKNL